MDMLIIPPIKLRNTHIQLVNTDDIIQSNILSLCNSIFLILSLIFSSLNGNENRDNVHPREA